MRKKMARMKKKIKQEGMETGDDEGEEEGRGRSSRSDHKRIRLNTRPIEGRSEEEEERIIDHRLARLLSQGWKPIEAQVPHKRNRVSSSKQEEEIVYPSLKRARLVSPSSSTQGEEHQETIKKRTIELIEISDDDQVLTSSSRTDDEDGRLTSHPTTTINPFKLHKRIKLDLDRFEYQDHTRYSKNINHHHPKNINHHHPKNIIHPSSSNSSRHPLPNFTPGPESRTEYAILVAEAERLRLEGNAAYKNSDYQAAIALYTQALLRYPSQSIPNQTFHPGYATSLANRASAHMARFDYPLAVQDLRSSLEAVEIPPLITSNIRNDLLKRLLRLIRCHLALLDHQSASHIFHIIHDPHSPIFIDPSSLSDQSSHHHIQLSNLSARLKSIQDSIEKLEADKAHHRWHRVLLTIQELEDRIPSWGFKLQPRHLPESWTLLKAEALVRSGHIPAAEQVLNNIPPFDSPSLEYQVVKAWISFGQGNLHEANKITLGILNRYPDDLTLRSLSQYIQGFLEPLLAIERTSDSHHFKTIESCEELLTRLTEPITTNLRIIVSTILCEQLYAVQGAMDGKAHHRIMVLSNEILTSYLKFSISSMGKTTSEPYRVYVIRLLLVQARSSLDLVPSRSIRIYRAILTLLTTVWIDLKDSYVSDALAEATQRINLRTHHHFSPPRASFTHSNPHSCSSTGSSSYSYSYSSFSKTQHQHQTKTSNQQSSHQSQGQKHHHQYQSRSYSQNQSQYDHQNTRSHRHTSSSSRDPKGYYRTLGLKSDATIQDIRKSFRTLSLTHHPDKGGRTELFQAINQAHSVLSNSESRSRYDLTGS